MRGTRTRTLSGGRGVSARRDLQKERFAAYFPRLFAYALAATGDDDAAREVAVASFTETFSMPAIRIEEFEVALFRAARALCRSEVRRERKGESLNPRERDVISLLFDAQLKRSQISELLGIGQAAVGSALHRGLKKLRAQFETKAARPAAHSFL